MKPFSVMGMISNCIWLWCFSCQFGKCGVLIYCHYSQVHSCYILTFWQVVFVDFKNRMQLCLKGDKSQWKCRMNCVGGIPEGRVYRYPKNNFQKFSTPSRIRQSSKQWHRPSCCLGVGSGFRNRGKYKCTRLPNVKSEYDPRTKKKQMIVLSWPCTSLIEPEQRSKALWRYRLSLYLHPGSSWLSPHAINFNNHFDYFIIKSDE